MTSRCEWCGKEGIYVDYHDQVWGVPVYDDRLLFEMLTLEGAQAGLSWLTILKKRENYVKAFDGFNVKKIAKYDQQLRQIRDESDPKRLNIQGNRAQEVVRRDELSQRLKDRIGEYPIPVDIDHQ